VRAFAWSVLWIAAGAVAVSGFFVSAFFPDYSALRLKDSGLPILLMPLLFGFFLGVLLTEVEIGHVVVASLLMTVFALVLVAVFLFAPVLANLPSVVEGLTLFTIRNVGLSATLLFPLTITGSVVGHAFAAILLPPEQMKEEIRRLREETRRWHEELRRLQGERQGETPKELEEPKH